MQLFFLEQLVQDETRGWQERNLSVGDRGIASTSRCQRVSKSGDRTHPTQFMKDISYVWSRNLRM